MQDGPLRRLLRSERILPRLLHQDVGDLSYDKEFWFAVREEYDKIKFLDKAEIPELRDRVCKKLNITEKKFDSELERAWINDDIRLDVGAPIGRYDVKYLVTSYGTRYFYMSFRNTLKELRGGPPSQLGVR